ncbi:hypothetical protein [Nonomuraea rubra]|uniref:hypothetical protein n=1 Tax=Nonomuraea rubra TaxID=46180 RepID=UPI0031F0FEA2
MDPLPAALERDDLPERAAMLLTYVWDGDRAAVLGAPAARPGGRRGRAERRR